MRSLEFTARIVRCAPRAGGFLQVHHRGCVQGGVEVEARDAVERLTLAPQVILHATHDQWRAQPLPGLVQFAGRQPQRAHDAGIERLLGPVVFDLAAECEAQEAASIMGAAPQVGADQRLGYESPGGFLAGFADDRR
jgi:hypothetical protein